MVDRNRSKFILLFIFETESKQHLIYGLSSCLSELSEVDNFDLFFKFLYTWRAENRQHLIYASVYCLSEGVGVDIF